MNKIKNINNTTLLEHFLNLFSIKFLYFFIISSLFSYFNLFVSILLTTTCICRPYAEADPGFQVRGAHLKKMRRAEGGAKNFGIFRVKNHDFILTRTS
jgi:hypothetical protein